MSEELMKEDNNLTMADLEDHFDDANPWNVVKRYLEKKTILPVKIEGIVADSFRLPDYLYLTLTIWNLIF